MPTRDDLGGLPSARTGSAIARISPQVADTSSEGRALATFGRQVSTLGAVLREKEDEADAFDTELRFQQFQANEAKALDEGMRATEPGQARDLPETFTQTYRDSAREFFASVPDALKPKYNLKLLGAERDFYGTVSKFSRQEQQRFGVQTLEDVKNRLITNSVDIDAARRDYDALLSTSPLTPIERDQVRRKHLREIDLYDAGKRIISIRDADDRDEIIRDAADDTLLSDDERQSRIEYHKDGMATVYAGTGAKARVSGRYAERFAGLFADLEAAGIAINPKQTGGYNPRAIRGANLPSQHAFGRAVDVNWAENAQGTPGAIDPELARRVAKRWGLKWGGDFSASDPMHFEIDPKAAPAIGTEAAPPVRERGIVPFAGLKETPNGEGAAGARLPTRVSHYSYLEPADRSALIRKAQAQWRALETQAGEQTKQHQDATAREGLDLLYKRELTKDWVDAHASDLNNDTYSRLMRAVTGPPEIRVTNAPTYRDLLERADEKPDDVVDEAGDAYAHGLLNQDAFERIYSKAQKAKREGAQFATPAWAKETRATVKQQLKPPPRASDAEIKAYTDALEEYDAYVDENRDTLDQKATGTFAQELIKRHRLKRADSGKQTLAIPRFTQVPRDLMTEEEVDAAVGRTVEALRGGKITREEAASEARLLKQWKGAFEAEMLAKGEKPKVKEKKPLPGQIDRAGILPEGVDPNRLPASRLAELAALNPGGWGTSPLPFDARAGELRGTGPGESRDPRAVAASGFAGRLEPTIAEDVAPFLVTRGASRVAGKVAETMAKAPLTSAATLGAAGAVAAPSVAGDQPSERPEGTSEVYGAPLQGQVEQVMGQIEQLVAQQKSIQQQRDLAVQERDAELTGKGGKKAGRGKAYEAKEAEIARLSAEAERIGTTIDGLNRTLADLRHRASPEFAMEMDKVKEAENARRKILEEARKPFEEEHPELARAWWLAPIIAGGITGLGVKILPAISARAQAGRWWKAVETARDVNLDPRTRAAARIEAQKFEKEMGKETWKKVALSYGGLTSTAMVGGGFLANVPDFYNLFLPAENPERRAYEAYIKLLPDNHPEILRTKKLLAELPQDNPARQAALAHFMTLKPAITKALEAGAEAAGAAVGMAELGKLIKPPRASLPIPETKALTQEAKKAAKAAKAKTAPALPAKRLNRKPRGKSPAND